MQNNNPLTKADLIQAIIMHILLLTIIIVNGYVQNKKTFLDLKLINSSTLTKPNEPNTATAPIKASLVDHKEIQQAVKRQEKVFADKVAREKKLEQQEQKIAKLTALSEQTAKKTKEEQDTLKKEKEALKKEQENLQKTANKIKQQQQELAAQQTKLEQLKQQAFKKKNLATAKPTQNQGINSIGEATDTLQTEIQNYHNKMYTKIINNRKVTSFFPEHLECSIKVKILPNGQLKLVALDQSSGNAAYDAFSEQAIYKSAPFDMPEDPKVNKELVDLDHVFIFTANTVNNI